MFCSQCGNKMAEHAAFCQKCGTAAHTGSMNTAKHETSQKAPVSTVGEREYYHRPPNQAYTTETDSKRPMPWLSIGLSAFGYFVFLFLGGDAFLMEVNTWDYISIFIGAGAFVAALLTIPKERTALRVVSIILSVLLTLSALGWVFM